MADGNIKKSKRIKHGKVLTGNVSDFVFNLFPLSHSGP